MFSFVCIFLTLVHSFSFKNYYTLFNGIIISCKIGFYIFHPSSYLRFPMFWPYRRYFSCSTHESNLWLYLRYRLFPLFRMYFQLAFSAFMLPIYLRFKWFLGNRSYLSCSTYKSKLILWSDFTISSQVHICV